MTKGWIAASCLGLALAGVPAGAALTDTTDTADATEGAGAASPAVGESGLFDRIDADGDGLITRAEAKAYRIGGKGRRFFKKVDTDGDGRISRDEAERYRTGRFETADLDRDGAVSKAEMIAAATRSATERAERLFARMDANGDGRVGADEYDAMTAPRLARSFNRYDADGDGVITKREMKRARR